MVNASRTIARKNISYVCRHSTNHVVGARCLISREMIALFMLRQLSSKSPSRSYSRYAMYAALHTMSNHVCSVFSDSTN